jgi:DMSO reductase anchor subunit
VIGAFMTLFLGPMFGLTELGAAAHPIAYPVTLFGLIAAQTFALVISTLHLGRPHRFYRAFNNLRYSPVSREVAAVAVFYNLLGVYAVLTAMPQLFGWLPESLVMAVHQGSGWLALAAGPAAVYFMHRIYRIAARPYWNHWQVLTGFFGSMLTLGPLLAMLVYMPVLMWQDIGYSAMLQTLALPMLLGLLLECYGLYRHAVHLNVSGGEGQAAHHEQITTFGKTYLARNGVLALNVVLLSAILLPLPDIILPALWLLIATSLVGAALVGRAMFYVLVIPTTMPGAFFWKNPGFQGHARDAGLAAMPQVGVQAAGH